jgi:hypothetical protein
MKLRRALAQGGSAAARGKRSVFPKRVHSTQYTYDVVSIKYVEP